MKTPFSVQRNNFCCQLLHKDGKNVFQIVYWLWIHFHLRTNLISDLSDLLHAKLNLCRLFKICEHILYNSFPLLRTANFDSSSVTFRTSPCFPFTIHSLTVLNHYVPCCTAKWFEIDQILGLLLVMKETPSNCRYIFSTTSHPSICAVLCSRNPTLNSDFLHSTVPTRHCRERETLEWMIW
jgi:hypothetical protein